MGTEHDIANDLQAAIEAHHAARQQPAPAQQAARQALDAALLAALSSIYVAAENARAGILDADHALQHIEMLSRLSLLAAEEREGA